MKRQSKIKTRDLQDILFNVLSYIFIFVFVILCIYPFYYIFIYSISDPTLAKNGIWLLPKGVNLNNYIKVMEENDFIQAFMVSVLRTVIGTAMTIFFTSILAYLVTRREMKARRFVYRSIVITMYLSAGLVPWYLTMKQYGLEDTFLLYVVPSSINAYYMILIKTYMEQIPDSMEESAQMEGAGFFRILFSIIMPLSKPILATCTVYAAVAQWNSWQDNFFLIHNRKLQTMQLILQKYINEADSIAKKMQSGMVVSASEIGSSLSPQAVRMTSIMIVTIPIILVYPFAQKYFTKGIMMGAIKG